MGPPGWTTVITLAVLVVLKATKKWIVNSSLENAVQAFGVSLPVSLKERVTKWETLFLQTPITHVKVHGKYLYCMAVRPLMSGHIAQLS